MSYRFDTRGLTSQQRAIINQRDKDDKRLRKEAKEKVFIKEENNKSIDSKK